MDLVDLNLLRKERMGAKGGVEILMDLVDLNILHCMSTILQKSRDPYGSRGSKSRWITNDSKDFCRAPYGSRGSKLKF